jgi:hypothetical protein
MASRSKKLREHLAAAERTKAQAQASFLKAEDALGELEQRESARAERQGRQAERVARRIPATIPERRGH